MKLSKSPACIIITETLAGLLALENDLWLTRSLLGWKSCIWNLSPQIRSDASLLEWDPTVLCTVLITGIRLHSFTSLSFPAGSQCHSIGLANVCLGEWLWMKKWMICSVLEPFIHWGLRMRGYRQCVHVAQSLPEAFAIPSVLGLSGKPWLLPLPCSSLPRSHKTSVISARTRMR